MLILWITLALLGLLLAALLVSLIPAVRMSGTLRFTAEPLFDLRVVMLWGWLVFEATNERGKVPRGRLLLFGRRVLETDLVPRPKEKKKTKQPDDEERPRPQRVLDPMQVLASVPGVVFDAIRIVMRAIDYRIYLELHYGFDDPALTGEVSGMLSTLYCLFPRIEVALYPKFWQPVWDGLTRFSMQFRPLGTGWQLVRLVLSARGRAAMRALRGDVEEAVSGQPSVINRATQTPGA